MKYILDTDICVYILKNRHPGIVEKFRQVKPADIGIPAIVEAELLLGAFKSAKRDETISKVRLLLEPLSKVPFGEIEAQSYAEIRSHLEMKGTPIGPNDYIIAATALANRSILVTHNTKEFSRVEGLVVQDWCADY
jgi:tRNA(fMet)-specific endonuclease VapC